MIKSRGVAAFGGGVQCNTVTHSMELRFLSDKIKNKPFARLIFISLKIQNKNAHKENTTGWSNTSLGTQSVYWAVLIF